METNAITQTTAAIAGLSPGLRIALWILAVPGLYCLLVVLGRRLKRRHGVQLGVLYHLFAFGCAVYFPAMILGLHRKWQSWMDYVAYSTIFLGGVFLIALVDRYVWELYFRKKHKVHVPKFLVEVVRLVILLVLAFLVLEQTMGKTFNSLLFTSGMAAVILGLAMQDSVGNIIAGLTLQLGKPYAQGDWLLLDTRYAQIVEINWRATRLKTNDDIIIEIPHRQMAGQTIINLSRPTPLHAMRISLGIDYGAPPSRVKDVLLHATGNAKGVAAEPKPKIYLKNFGDSSIEYEIKFWLEDQSQYFDVCDAIRTNMWCRPAAWNQNSLSHPYRFGSSGRRAANNRNCKQQPASSCGNNPCSSALVTPNSTRCSPRTSSPFRAGRESHRTRRERRFHVHPRRWPGQRRRGTQRPSNPRRLAQIRGLLR